MKNFGLAGAVSSIFASEYKKTQFLKRELSSYLKDESVIRIGLQDHGSYIWFRNIKIKNL